MVTELSSISSYLGNRKVLISHIAIITNIYSYIPDYHENLETIKMLKSKYIKIKREEDYLICNYHQRQVIESEELKAKTLYFSTQQEVDGIYIKDGFIVWKGVRIINTERFSIAAGEHNLEKYISSCACLYF